MTTGIRPRAGLPRAFTGLALACCVWAAPAVGFGDIPPPPSSLVRKAPPEPHEDMPEDLRAQMDRIVVIAARDPAEEAVSGSYEKSTYGVVGGAIGGYEVGEIRKEVGPVPVLYRIPGTAIPGAIIGALFGGVQREIQQLRDAMTEELVDAESTPLADDGLAMDVYSRLRRVSGLTSRVIAPTTPVPEGTDAMLHVKFAGVAIDVQGEGAVITTTAVASLRRLADDVSVYRTIVHYSDRDSLRNWTEDDNRLWHSYVNYARHYLGREIAARVYNRVELPHSITPEQTDSVRRDRKKPLHFISETTQPELAWTLKVGDVSGTPFAGAAGKLDESATSYDVEIYNRDRLVWLEEGVAEPPYTVPMALECGEYRWSVRPSWQVGGTERYGDWMRFPPPAAKTGADEDDEARAEPPPPNGLSGREASVAPAYTQDFPALTVTCD